MNSFPEIKTERLLLTELKADDISDIVKHAANKKIADFTLNLPHPYAEKDAIYWINLAHQGFQNGTNIIFGIKLKDDNQFIGGIDLTVEKTFNRAEIGYWIAEPFWSKGYATEATVAIIAYGFDQLKLNKLTSSYLAKNIASGRVMQKSGMVREGVLKEHILKGGEYHDLILYGITKNQ
ncbi:GNAT family N-acetyltransferase [Flagellimonas meridianipacifica]|uniref:RimJ/RimL family protein N-acetyltransferase n=1 Tax=Flagellimonas meridianipacifica TaxID=1080225 RepID=A0A2T0MBJ3_9FLAO|nr:GNAT family protein [Allomuricauda pacifica]PRX54782.1 RimJ/RimL family protein N-acetyltransferase [Allomuricauda pacifica]